LVFVSREFVHKTHAEPKNPTTSSRNFLY